jgi:hypothetical protein
MVLSLRLYKAGCVRVYFLQTNHAQGFEANIFELVFVDFIVDLRLIRMFLCFAYDSLEDFAEFGLRLGISQTVRLIGELR